MPNIAEPRVAGEPLSQLLRALPYFNVRKVDERCSELSAEMPDEVANPFLRALDRVEEELRALDHHLARLTGRTPPREDGQRGMDALVILVHRICVTQAKHRGW